MRIGNRALAAAGTGFALAAIVGCGGSSGLLTADQAAQLKNQLQLTSQALSARQCQSAQSTIKELGNEIDALRGVDQTLIANLQQGLSTIKRLASQECPVPATTVTTQTNTSTTKTKTSTTKTSTTPTQTSTNPTNTSTNPTQTSTTPTQTSTNPTNTSTNPTQTSTLPTTTTSASGGNGLPSHLRLLTAPVDQSRRGASGSL